MMGMKGRITMFIVGLVIAVSCAMLVQYAPTVYAAIPMGLLGLSLCGLLLMCLALASWSDRHF